MTNKEVAMLLGLTSRRVQQLVKDGTLTKDADSNKRYRNLKSSDVIVEYIEYIKTSNPDEYAKLKIEKLKQEVKIKQSSAKMSEIKLNEYKGRMHNAEDVENFTNDLVFTIRSALMAMPSRLAIDVAKESDPNIVREMIEKEANAILYELSNYQYDKNRYLERLLEREGLESIDMDENTE